MDEHWMKAAKNLREAYLAFLDRDACAPHQLHDAIVDVRRAELAALERQRKGLVVTPTRVPGAPTQEGE